MASYKDSGVDIDAGNESANLISQSVKKTYSKAVLSGVGGFGAAYSLAAFKGMKEPVLVSTMDGVGTKVKIASLSGNWDYVGMDIVNHCSNDILALGAKPLFFLDYIASSKISPAHINQVVKGMAEACHEIGCALVGGETAEMPGVYEKGETDIVGCMVGIVDKENKIDGSKIKSGDVLIGLASNGLHTNGFSLARKVLFDEAGLKVDDKIDSLGCTLGEELLKVHRSYSMSVIALSEKVPINGIAHITGGGLEENLARILPKKVSAKINYSSINVHPIFKLIQEKGSIPEKEMFRVFNMGIGLVLVVNKSVAEKALAFLEKKGEKAFVIGSISN